VCKIEKEQGNINVASLQTTPLLINPVSTASAFSQGEKSSEYFIGVTAIQIVEKTGS
jgi:hypothetical protein